MKFPKTLIALCLFPFFTHAQSVQGDWNATLKVPGAEIPLVLHIKATGDSLTSTLDSPAQGANGIPVASTTLKDSILSLNLPVLNAGFSGTWRADNISGEFKQNGMTFPLTFARGGAKAVERPQEPKKPYPYHSEEVTFENQSAQLRLAGTFTAPSTTGKFPAVVLITGSGPQNRDEELAGHKPFLVLSDHLTRQGIAVLRFDDRGTASSTGNFGEATSADFATDVNAAIDYLKTRKDVDLTKIGLIGHSEGGLIAPIVAVKSEDVHFIVLLAGPGVSGERILETQAKLIGKAGGQSDAELEKAAQINQKVYQAIKEGKSIPEVKTRVASIIKDALQALPESERAAIGDGDAFVKQRVDMIATPWFKHFLGYDPAPTLAKVKCPVLAINGEKDLQVPAKENLHAIELSLTKAGNKNVTIKELPGLNHLFQESTTGAPFEYGTITQTFSPTALNVISEWINGKAIK